MAAIEEEPVRQPATLIPEPSLRRINGRKCHSGRKYVRGGTAYPNGRSRMRIACSYRCVQHYNGQSETSQQPETPVFIHCR